MAIRKFEDIRAGQEARVLTKQIYALTQDGALSKDFGLRDQLQRAGERFQKLTPTAQLNQSAHRTPHILL